MIPFPSTLAPDDEVIIQTGYGLIQGFMVLPAPGDSFLIGAEIDFGLGLSPITLVSRPINVLSIDAMSTRTGRQSRAFRRAVRRARSSPDR